jgi:SAM-dependent methyltransferase
MNAYSNRRYLAAKKTVDDRALNQNVVGRLRTELLASENTSPRVLEIGGGLGTMVTRLVDWNVLKSADYQLLDVDAELLADSRDWFRTWAASTGFSVETSTDAVRIQRDDTDVTVTFIRAEIGDYLDAPSGGASADLLIANAFLDLVDVPNVLPLLFRRAAPNGLFWFPINYDGDTIFQPDQPGDAALMQAYNRSMDERVRYGRRAGDSLTGRRLFGHLAAAGATVLSAGASDWVVHGRGGRYEADEAYFLDHILYTIDEALEKRPEVDAEMLAQWVAVRRHELERGELVYAAHQLDFVGRCNVESSR